MNSEHVCDELCEKRSSQGGQFHMGLTAAQLSPPPVLSPPTPSTCQTGVRNTCWLFAVAGAEAGLAADWSSSLGIYEALKCVVSGERDELAGGPATIQEQDEHRNEPTLITTAFLLKTIQRIFHERVHNKNNSQTFAEETLKLPETFKIHLTQDQC